MDREIPDHAGVGLEQPEVHAHRVEYSRSPSSPASMSERIFRTAPV